MELLQNPALRLFGFTYMILVLKMVAVGYSTSFYRFRHRHFATPEDYALQGLQPKTTRNDDIERTRRAHRNDLENILPYFGVGLFYALSGPSMFAANLCFIGYTVARVLHSIFYVAGLQPWRTLAFGVAQLIMVVMAVTLLLRLA
jgi:uncharacterized MAPEG superfamily protein